MKQKKVSNEETKVNATIEMNDRDYLNDMLATEKAMSVDMTIALNEASNEALYKELYKLFENIKESQRNLFELAFSKGWYVLEKAEQKKIDEKLTSLNKKYDEFYKIDE